MAVRSWIYHGTLQYEVDAEADLAAIINPKMAQVALALAEGTLWFYTGLAWQQIAGGGGGGDTLTLSFGGNVVG